MVVKSYQHQIFELIKDLTGEKNCIVIPKIFVKFLGNRDNASFLSQILYWSDKTKRRDQFFFKTDKEFADELYMTIYALRKARATLEKMNIIETKIVKANGNPTIHYKINHEAFIDRFLRFQKNEIANSQELNCENEKTLTEITHKIPSEITNVNGRRLEKKSLTIKVKLSFKEFLIANKENNLNQEAVEAIKYYINKYECTFKKNHQKYCVKTWLEQLDTMLVGEMDTLSVEEVETMIDKHFQTDYKGKCDYQLLHFNTEGIKKNRFYEVCY